MNQPRVLITRSPHQASELADRLRSAGVEPLLIPAIELAEPSSFVPLDAAITQLGASLSRFHWLVFTSANAVEAFARRWIGMGEGNRPSRSALTTDASRPDVTESRVPTASIADAASRELPPGLRVAAIGPATARALQAAGWSSDLMGPSAVAESLTAALLPYARQPDGSPTRFLLVRAEVARDHLPETLRAAGAEVTIAPAYRTVIPASSIAQLQSLFGTRERWPDAVTFTSSSTASNLHTLLEESGLALPPEIIRVSIGPITSRTLRELNLPPHAEAREPTVAALAEAVISALNGPREGER
jgi:uroporphyrinogen-III synthase